MPTINADTIIDERYRVLSKIGSGGMADVFVAEDLQLGRKVALKLLHERFAADAEFVERFRREASSAAGLQHPNVVQVYDRGEWEGTYYIAMEYLEGRSLKEIIRDEGAMAPERAIEIVLQILRAARFAHKRGVIHRDIKPHNVIVDSEDKVKVTDFGIALAGASDMTETGSIMGTAQYLSPEQAQGEPVGAQSDLYAIGVVLYELLTGRVPFHADTVVSIALKHVSEEPVLPRKVNPTITPTLEAIVMRAMVKSPEQRFGDADEFIAALEGELKGLNTGAQYLPPTTVLPAPRPAQVAYSPPPPPPVYEEELEETTSERRWLIWALAVIAVLALAVGAYFLFIDPKKTRVPNVVGQRSEVAAQILRNRGFDVNIELANNATVPRERVATQSPQPNIKAKTGSVVTIVVSSGPGLGVIPFLQGVTQKTAEKRLTDAGYEIDIREQASDAIPKGRVIDTEPPQRSQLELGQTVTVFISSGPGKVAMPDVTGLLKDDAEARLQSIGLVVSIKTEESTTDAADTVLSQDPRAGRQVEKGSTATLTIATAPEVVAVPDVLGETVDDAVNSLTEAGFRVRTTLRTVQTADQDGVVIEQNPSSGSERKTGTRVTVIIGRLASTPGTVAP